MHHPDFLFGLTHGDLIYDIETYHNAFTVGFIHRTTLQRWYFEISHWRNDIVQFQNFISTAQQLGCRLSGYNNLGFDYPVIHKILNNVENGVTVEQIYEHAMSIINTPFNQRFNNMVWESDWIIPQIDLYKIHHFDNAAKATSLKMLEFNMRMDSIEDLPFPVGTVLTPEQLGMLKSYMWHDIQATLDFHNASMDMITFRESLTAKYGKNFMNFNDTKIGAEIFIHELQQAGIRTDCKTPRASIRLADVIIPSIQFEHPEFQRIHEWFKAQVITETKGVFENVNCTINGVQYDFGTGGLHAAVSNKIYHSTDTHVVQLRDVASYYPNLAIKNNWCPEHLGYRFCEIYEGLYNQRKLHAKGTAENAALKLALNGTYGNSNNKYSPFYDPQFTMAITVNGQLLLCLLIEKLLKASSFELIAANTDGIAYKVGKHELQYVEDVCDWWQAFTRLELETDHVDHYFAKDVNNYTMVEQSGKVKRKGKYEYELGWHQNQSALVVPKAAEAALVHGADIREFITNHDDIFDFFLRAKVPRSTQLIWGEEEVEKIVRYYISNTGRPLKKVMPAAGPVGQYKRASKLTDEYFEWVHTQIPEGAWDERIHTKNRSVYTERVTDINSGWLVQVCNRLPSVLNNEVMEERGHDGADIAEYLEWRKDINIDWYVQQAEKLVKPLLD